MLVAGLGGAVFLGLKNSYSEPVYSDTDDSNEIDSAIIEKTDIRYSIGLSMTGEYNINFGEIPDKLIDAIIETLQNAKWTETTFDSSLDIDLTAFITFARIGDGSFSFKIDKNGNAVFESRNDRKYYIHDVYYDIISVIAQYIPYCDWTSMIGGETGIALDMSFKNHADEIKINGVMNGIMYPSDLKKELGLKFFECGEFEAYIQENGDLNIRYKSIDDISYAIEYNRIYFSSSPELYYEIASAVNSGNDRFFNLVDETIAGNTHMDYTSGTFQNSQGVGFEDVNTEKLCSEIESPDWIFISSEHPPEECFIAGDFFITMDGKIYSNSESILYSAENQDYSAINNAIDEIIKTDDAGYMMYFIDSSENRFSTMPWPSVNFASGNQ